MQREHPLKQFYNIIDHGSGEDKMGLIPEFPRIIELEITNHCNFQCIMCKTGTGTAKRKRGYMAAETYEKLIREAAGRKIAFKFVGQGEPTLHPRFLEYIKKAKQNGVICHLTTNGSMFDKSFIGQLIDTQIDSVKFSFQGVDREGYMELRGKDDFDHLLEKIGWLYELRGEKEFPYITVATSVTNESKEEIEEFRQKCSRICDNLEIGITTLEFIDLSKIKKKQTHELLAKMKEDQTRKKRRYKCCHQVFDVITLHWNGSINACCADNDDVMVLGNLAENSIQECWNGKKEQAYREILAVNDYEKLPLCKDCYDVYGWTYQGDE